MFTFIKKVIKTGTETHAYPLEPMPVDKNFRGKPEHTPQQCIGCAACVNACPSNALTVEIDLATNQLAWQFNLGRCIFCGRCEEVCPTAAIKLSPEYELAVWKKEDFLQQSRFAICHCRGASVRSRCRRRSTTPSRCSSITAIPAPSCTAKASKPARNASARNAWCRPIVLN
ncbi:formate hydrogenlyase complex 3 iron-sulfur protein [Klebsiella pneumoniae]|uniref:Formate hydrogenlyase complex 3 iron-sulfur protein n=1 Tax=Klebsiella pneumoniae TaxID=573 RepID=A0AB74GW81_KLEPN|nr:formate hydrogenlyase complex 3 iron-sulfur protein [Klebsiella pneumoniae]